MKRFSFPILFGGIWLVVGLPFLITAIVVFVQDRRLDREGLLVQGMVLAKDIRRSSSSGSSGSRSSTSYYVTYRFRTADEQVIEDESQVDYSRWTSLTERGPIPIVYLPDRPASNKVAGESHLLLVVIFGILGAVFGIGGSAIFGWGVRSAWLSSRLERSGVEVPATVVGVEESNISVNRRRQWRLTYEYQDLRGRTRTKSFHLPEEEARAWKPGAPARVRIDPDRPSRAVWMGSGATADVAEPDMGGPDGVR